MRKKIALCIIFFLLGNITVFAQNHYGLDELIKLAQKQSIFARQAQNSKLSRYWQYRFFQSNYRPQLELNTTLPDFTRSISSIALPDGTQSFVQRSFAVSDIGLNLSQTVSPLGGTVFMRSSLQRIDLFGQNAGISYASTPLMFGYSQKLFGYNNLRWDKKIEPLRYQESVKEYSETMEAISIQVCDLFFNMLLSQVSLDLAKTNLSNNDTIYKIGQGRYSLGTIAENELLQLELNVISSAQEVNNAQLNLENARLLLNTYLGFRDNPAMELVAPGMNEDIYIDEKLALQQAQLNRKQYIEFARRELEAQRELAEVKGRTGFQGDLFATYGITQTGPNVMDSYANPLGQQGLRIGLRMPLLDWGRQKAQLQTAMSNKELTENIVEQERMRFENDIVLKVKQFKLQRAQLVASAKADSLAQRQYEIARQRYMVSKISITDLNISLQQKDAARQRYLAALKSYWVAYYEIRMLTMYDFFAQKPISYE